jgi:hypothetical protein
MKSRSRVRFRTCINPRLIPLIAPPTRSPQQLQWLTGVDGEFEFGGAGDADSVDMPAEDSVDVYCGSEVESR